MTSLPHLTEREDSKMSYILDHTVFGFCWWDLPAAIGVIAVAVVFIVKCRNMKKQKEEPEDQLAAFDAENVPTSTDKL